MAPPTGKKKKKDKEGDVSKEYGYLSYIYLAKSKSKILLYVVWFEMCGWFFLSIMVNVTGKGIFHPCPGLASFPILSNFCYSLEGNLCFSPWCEQGCSYCICLKDSLSWSRNSSCLQMMPFSHWATSWGRQELICLVHNCKMREMALQPCKTGLQISSHPFPSKPLRTMMKPLRTVPHNPQLLITAVSINHLWEIYALFFTQEDFTNPGPLCL